MNDKQATSTVEQAHFDQVQDRSNTHSLKWELYKGQDVIPMWVADMDFAVAEPIMEAIRDRVAHPILGYTIAPDSLIDTIVEYVFKEYGWKIEKQWLVFLPGVVTGLAVSCRAFCKDGDHVMVNPPIYHHFFDSHDQARHNLVKVPLHKAGGRWTYNLADMQAACENDLSMIMMCSPHNPTGTVFTEQELRSVATMCEQNDITIISDEIHCDLVLDQQVRHVPTAVACPDQADRIVTLMSASKTWNLAGLNASFAIISNEQRRDQFKAACTSIVPPVPPLSYTATEAALRDGGPWREALLSYLSDNLSCIDAAIAKMPGLKLEPLQATYLAWIDASELKLNDTQGFFVEHGVGLSSGEQFGQPHYLRLNFACPRSQLEKALERMAAAVATLN